MTSPRAELIAETAITLLAERGMRGLTHRAVDEAAGLPPGSTSNLARTRAALLELTLVRLTELENRRFALFADTGAPRPGTGDGDGGTLDMGVLADLVARMLHLQVTDDRRRTLARYELALEATRRPELRAIYNASGRGFRAVATDLMAAAGSCDPVRHGHHLVVFAEGVMFDALAGAGAPLAPADLRRGVHEVLTGLLR
ncbi:MULTISPECIES: TetR/AcrR family transcriptional regulator [Thermomonosporaceae]|uniref:TetR/AcrR family transcriptional regulator n=1 Tax=Thermomonosporaceae TaxID=2012 RepID=UPI00255AC8B6|nr:MULTISPECIES: TetR/AcrR family transcriptional regulator [Thermomonosporaceae]MDL4776935.1 TetR/AcrR family transcriptional regulator [Actinomadura xylanilytica]